MADEPTGFAELPWDTGQSALMGPCSTMPKIYQTPGGRDFQVPGRPPDVFNHPNGTAEFSCARSLHVGGIDWNPRLILLDGRLVAYQFTVERAYDDLRAIALQRFGPPASVKTEQYRTGAGIPIDGEVLEWRWPGGTWAILSERFSRISTTSLLVGTRAYSEHLAKRRQGQLEKSKKSF